MEGSLSYLAIVIAVILVSSQLIRGCHLLPSKEYLHPIGASLQPLSLFSRPACTNTSLANQTTQHQSKGLWVTHGRGPGSLVPSVHCFPDPLHRGHPLIHLHCHHRHLSCLTTGNRMLTTALKRIPLSNLSWTITTQALLQVRSPMTCWR